MKNLLACSGLTCRQAWMQTAMPGFEELQLCWPMTPVLLCLMLTNFWGKPAVQMLRELTRKPLASKQTRFT